MNFIRKTWLIMILCLLLTACGADSPTAPTDPPEEPPVETTGEPASGVIFTYIGKDYELRQSAEKAGPVGIRVYQRPHMEGQPASDGGD